MGPTALASVSEQSLRWDIFCRVIDNFGDIGVCWRLAAALAARGQQVRLWADDASPLAWMAPGGCQGVEVCNWQPDRPMPLDAQPGDVVIEAFGCEIDQSWIATNSIAPRTDFMPATPLKAFKSVVVSPVWINLEYLSAESFVQRSHGLASPVMSGAAKGLTKWFFYPGFTQSTGGLIREPHAVANSVATTSAQINAPRSGHHTSLFCYEPPALADLLQQLANGPQHHELHVLPGRGKTALEAAFLSKNCIYPVWNMHELLSINEHSYMPQSHYDALLRGCDLNFVRGEDSLVRALWAGRAFVWQIYPQPDGAHEAKLEAFLDWLQAPPDLREFHRVWNGLSTYDLPAIDTPKWQVCVKVAQKRLLAQHDLISQLLDFVEEKRNLPA